MRWMVGLIIATHMALQLHGACGSPGLKWLGRTGDVVAAYDTCPAAELCSAFLHLAQVLPCACARSR